MAGLLDWLSKQKDSAMSDYAGLMDNYPNAQKFGSGLINNINSAAEGYSQWQRLQDQNFGPNQSVIASGFMHPQKGLSKLADWFTNNVNTAAGLPDPNQQDEASMYAYGPNIDQQAESGLNLAGLLQTGAFASGAAPKSAGGTLGTFIGPKSMGWNHDAANTATKLLDNGVDPAQVWKEHLIGRMPDKSLFSEIDDSGTKFNLKNAPLDDYGAQEMPIYDAVSHKSLKTEYPDLSSLSALHFPSEQYKGASFDPEDKVITFGHEAMKQGKSVSLHELQHAIQEKEGWARGGSPEQMKEEALAMLRRDVASGEIGSTEQAMDMLPMAQHNAYRRLTGEAQARATQDRMNMNMQQRRDNYPLAGDKLSDIPLDQLINRYGDNGPSMSMSIKNPNLNAGLLDKHLSGQKLTPEEMALYEKNGSAMETPQLQRYNLGNANAQGGSTESRAGILGWDTPVYHGRYKDYAKPKQDTTMYTSDNPDYASIYTHPSASSLGGKKQSDFEDLQPNVMPLLQRSKDILDTRTANGLKIFNNDFYRKYGNGTPLTDKGLPDWVDAHDFGEMFDDTGSKFKGVYADEGAVPDGMGNGNVISRGISTANFDPKNIRSRFAAFDPLRKNSSSLLASGLLGSLLLNNLGKEADNAAAQ